MSSTMNQRMLGRSAAKPRLSARQRAKR